MLHNTNSAFRKPWSQGEGKNRTQTECKFYQQTGNCAFGDRCHYKHTSQHLSARHEAPQIHIGTNITSTSSRPTTLTADSKQVCKFWLKSGSCGRGEKCWFSHTDEMKPNTTPEEGSQAGSANSTAEHHEDEICWGWKAGRCNRTADACRWRHDDPGKSNHSTSKDPLILSGSTDTSLASWRSRTVSEQENIPTIARDDTRAEVWLKMTVCKFWEAGGCVKGDKCQFVHGTDEKNRDTIQPNPFKTIPCRFWTAGNCLKGETCPFFHDKTDEKVLPMVEDHQSTTKKTMVKWKEELAYTDRFIVMDKNLVTFGPGLEVRNVTPSFEISKIAVRGLSLDTTQDAIAGLFTDRGIASEDVFVPYRTRPDKNGVGEALVYVNAMKNPEIVDELQGVTLSDQVLDIRDSERVNGGAAHQGTGAEDGLPFLEISWKSPTETIVAQYTSCDEAAQQVEALNGKMWEGRRLNASVEKKRVARPGLGALLERGGGRPTTRPTAGIKISNCPLNSSGNPRFSEFIHTSKITKHDISPCSSEKAVRQRLAKQDGVVMSTYKTIADENTPFAKIRVNFRDWNDVARAHTALNDHKLSTIAGETPLLRATFPARHRYQVTIPMRQYRAQTKQWNSLPSWSTTTNTKAKETAKDAYIQTDTVYGDRGSIMAIKVVGDDDKATGALKVRVEGLVAGECLDATYWHPTFGFNEDTRSMCNRIWESTNVYAKVDNKARALRMYGEPSMVEKAKILVREEVERLGGIETVRVIDWRGGVGFFVQEGLAKLKDIVGEDRVCLNLTCNPPKITIQGSEEARYDLDRIIEEGKNSAAGGHVQKLGDGGATCPICTEDVVNGEELGCGHTYCTGCLKHLLSSIVDTKAFPIVCWGDDSTCRSPITLPFLRRFIRHQIISKLAEAAFVGYLETHPHELKYCPTPDCRQIYRHYPDAKKVRCPSCLFEICATCDREAHGGISCEAAKQAEQGDEQLEKAGCKKCPGCPAWILKSEGCNHMHCKFCNTHFCWVCGTAFGKSERGVYDHMNREHGGIYDDVVPDGVEIGQAGARGFVAEQADLLAEMERLRG